MKHRIFTLSALMILFISACTQNAINQKSSKSHFEQYFGEYETRPNENIRIFAEGNELKIEGPGQPTMTLIPTNTVGRFFLKEFNVHIEFVKEKKKVIKLLMVRGDGQTLESPKIK